jgi:hypothetical protein
MQADVIKNLPGIVEPHFGVLMFGVLAYQNFFYLMQTTRQQHESHYREHFDD